MIKKINGDLELKQLNDLWSIGAIHIFWSEEVPSGGMGQSLCLGKHGLFFYEWNEYDGSRKEIPITAAMLSNFQFTCNRLRQMIVDFTDHDTYLKHAAKFGYSIV